VTLDERPSAGKSKVRLSDKFKRALTDIFYQVSNCMEQGLLRRGCIIVVGGMIGHHWHHCQ